MSKEYVEDILKDVEVGGSHYYGMPLEVFSKEELMKICVLLGRQTQEESYEHSRQLNVLAKLINK